MPLVVKKLETLFMYISPRFKTLTGEAIETPWAIETPG